MKLIKEHLYGLYDPCDDNTDWDTYDSDEVRLVDENSNVIMSGDYYHDKIEDKIIGFMECLEYLKHPFSFTENKLLFQDDEVVDTKHIQHLEFDGKKYTKV